MHLPRIHIQKSMSALGDDKMNERIRQLAAQAGIGIDGMGYGEGNVEEFAELIVQECANRLLKAANTGHDEGTETYNLLLSEASVMKRHFGVK